VFDAFFAGNHDVSEAVHRVHELAHVLVILPLRGCDQFDRLREGFMPFG